MRRAIVFAHYDRDGAIDDYVVDAVTAYRRLADRIVFVSASTFHPTPPLAPLVDEFVARDNVGYDFCSWRAGIEALGTISNFDELLCVNDSVYGPLVDLGPALRDPRVADADLWGMCLSDQGTKRRGRRSSCPHLQSWFFAMRRPVLESEAFRRFWRSVHPLDDKDDIIDRYEIGMSEHFARAGFRIGALYDTRTHGPASLSEVWPHLSWHDPRRSLRLVKKSRRGTHNPSELFPLRLIDAGVPYVKAGVFRVNHYGLNLDHVLDGIGGRMPYDTGLIEKHLDRVGWAGQAQRLADGNTLTCRGTRTDHGPVRPLTTVRALGE